MLADKSEGELFSLMRSRLRTVIALCNDLANLPAQGPSYIRMRAELKEIEELCRQAAYYRDDARWLRIGMLMEEVHQQSRHWMRYRFPRFKFLWLSERCQALLTVIEELRTKATGRMGQMLPKPQRAPDRTEGRLVQVRAMPNQTAGGILLP